MEARSDPCPEEVRGYYRKILPFYELESMSRAHLAFWRGVARDSDRVLEFGSGFGYITADLGRRESAVGVDICLEMLARARRLASGRPGSAGFVAADVRRPPFHAVFDLVIAPADPLSHLTRLADRRRALAGVARVLVPGGRFVLEGLWRRPGSRAAPRRTIRHAGGVLEIDEAWTPAGHRELWHARYRYRDRRTGEPDRTCEADFVARAWPARGLRRFFESCGLEVERICGGLDGRPFRASARRLVVFARRRSR